MAGEPASLLGSVPGMIYRTRLVPPFDSDFISEEMGAVVGHPASDFVGPEPKRRWLDFMHPDDRDRVREAMIEGTADGATGEVEYRVRRADGSEAWILSRARRVVDEDGTPWLHGTAVDVTAHHEAQELALRLDAEQIRRAEIQASRARIVEAADEARRKLERDLHDGAQQRLVTALLTLKLAAAQPDTAAARELVVEAAEQLEHGLADLRELAQGIHPAVLTDRGLGPAIESLAARSPVPVELNVTETRPAPAVEAAIYFTVGEALNNIAKYAQATQARVTVAVDGATVVAEIADDGVGGADARSGSGLRGLADRLDALGGTLEVQSESGAGTQVRATAPLSFGVDAAGRLGEPAA
jgi:PAS domain S-box-containing protein